jgi:hypothetical protein
VSLLTNLCGNYELRNLIGLRMLDICLSLQDSSVTIDIRQIGVSAWSDVTSTNQRCLPISIQAELNYLSQRDFYVFVMYISIIYQLFFLEYLNSPTVLLPQLRFRQLQIVILFMFSANCSLQQQRFG